MIVCYGYFVLSEVVMRLSEISQPYHLCHLKTWAFSKFCCSFVFVLSIKNTTALRSSVKVNSFCTYRKRKIPRFWARKFSGNSRRLWYNRGVRARDSTRATTIHIRKYDWHETLSFAFASVFSFPLLLQQENKYCSGRSSRSCLWSKKCTSCKRWWFSQLGRGGDGCLELFEIRQVSIFCHVPSLFTRAETNADFRVLIRLKFYLH